MSESKKSLGVSDVVWQALIAGVVTVTMAYMTHQNKLALDENRESAARHAAEQSEKLTAVETAVTSVKKEAAKITTATQEIPKAAAVAADKLVEAKAAESK